MLYLTNFNFDFKQKLSAKKTKFWAASYICPNGPHRVYYITNFHVLRAILEAPENQVIIKLCLASRI